MSDFKATSVSEVIFKGVVTRCGCSEHEKLADDWHGFAKRPCPKPRQVEDLGVLSYRSRNPFKTWAWKFKRYLTGLLSVHK